MYPTLLEIGPFIVYSLWLCVAIGFFTALLIVNKMVQKSRLPLSFLADGSLWLFLGGIIGARLMYVVMNGAVFDFLNIWDRNFSPLGAMIGIILVLVLLCKTKEQKALQWLDILSVGVLGSLIWSNLGAFLDGSNSGTPTDLPWGISLQNSMYAVPIHPVQLYATLYCLILTIVFYSLFMKKWYKTSGLTTIAVLGSYSIARFIEEFFRGDEMLTILGIRSGFILAFTGILISGLMWYFLFQKKKTTPALED